MIPVHVWVKDVENESLRKSVSVNISKYRPEWCVFGIDQNHLEACRAPKKYSSWPEQVCTTITVDINHRCTVHGTTIAGG